MRRLLRRYVSSSIVVEPTFDAAGSISADTVQRAASTIQREGVAILPRLYRGTCFSSISSRFIGLTDTVLNDLSERSAAIEIGSARGFHEVCLRSQGRYDVTCAFDDFTAEQLEPIEAIMRDERVLGASGEQTFCGVVYSEPGSPPQKWHADSLHLYSEHTPPNLINGLVALHDITLDQGPTEFVPGSQRDTNHLVNPRVNGKDIVYQFLSDPNAPEQIGASGTPTKMELPAGTVILFDDRVLHRGGGNSSEAPRYVGYFSYKRDWFVADTHFEATRSLYNDDGDAASASASASAPAPALASASTLAEAVRDEFPALGDHAGCVFADGAGGSQVHDSVIAAVADHMRRGAANLGGAYPTSELCLETTRAARGASADLFGCGPDEVTFGHNMTTLTYHLAHAVMATAQRGDNIVLSRLEHDANAGPWVRLARDAGVEVRWIDVGGPACELDLDSGLGAIDIRTKLVAVGYASNALGTINDVERVCAAARSAGALSYVDAVAYAPHSALDVARVGCDFMACSPYKFFGPHAGLLFGRRDVMRSFPAHKIRPASDALPSDDSYQISRWELGTQNFEALAGVVASVDYIATLGDRLGGDGEGGASATTTRRERILAGWDAVDAHELVLKMRFLEGARSIANLRVFGFDDPSDAAKREPTFAIGRELDSISASASKSVRAHTAERGAPGDGFAHPEWLAQELCNRNVFCTSGNHYATFWERYGAGTDGAPLSMVDGAARLGFLHYNTEAEIDQCLEALEAVCKV